MKTAHEYVINNRHDNPKVGRPNKVTKIIRYFVAISTIFYPELSSSELAPEVETCFNIQIGETTINTLRHSLNMKNGLRIRL